MKTPIEDAFSTLPDTPARAHCILEYRNTDIKEISTFSTSLGRLGSNLFVPLRCYQSEMIEHNGLLCAGVQQDDYQNSLSNSRKQTNKNGLNEKACEGVSTETQLLGTTEWTTVTKKKKKKKKNGLNEKACEGVSTETQLLGTTECTSVTKKKKKKKMKKKNLSTDMIDLFDNKESEYEEDDFMVVPEAIKEKIFSVILEKLRPALLDHFKKKCENFKFLGIAAEHISYECLCSCRGPLKPAFLQNHQIDLYLMERYIYYSNYEYPYIDGKICVGAAIRLSDWIGNQECAAELKEIVQDFFTPHELPDPKTLVPSYWQ